MVFVPEGKTMEFIQLAALRTVQLINLATTVLEPCRSYGIQMVCATWLRPCFVAPNNGEYRVIELRRLRLIALYFPFSDITHTAANLYHPL